MPLHALPAPARQPARLPAGLVAPARPAPAPSAPAAKAVSPAPADRSPLEYSLASYLVASKPAPPAPPGSRTMTIPMAEAAKKFDVYPTAPNMHTFVAWFKTFDRPGVLGPTHHDFSTEASMDRERPSDPAAVRALQAALARRGYAVAATGTFDAVTARAVVAFKRAQGFREPFLGRDGRPAVLPYADERVVAALMRVG